MNTKNTVATKGKDDNSSANSLGIKKKDSTLRSSKRQGKTVANEIKNNHQNQP